MKLAQARALAYLLLFLLCCFHYITPTFSLDVIPAAECEAGTEQCPGVTSPPKPNENGGENVLSSLFSTAVDAVNDALNYVRNVAFSGENGDIYAHERTMEAGGNAAGNSKEEAQVAAEDSASDTTADAHSETGGVDGSVHVTFTNLSPFRVSLLW